MFKRVKFKYAMSSRDLNGDRSRFLQMPYLQGPSGVHIAALLILSRCKKGKTKD